MVEAVEETLEDLGPSDLALGSGVLALSLERGSELDGGDVVPPESWRFPYAASRSGAAVFS